MPEMFHGLGLQMAQRQEMVMTPQMIQSMELLQLPLLELEQRIQTELRENPALELSDLKDDFLGDAAGEATPELPRAAAEAVPERGSGEEEYTERDLRAADQSDFDWDDVYDGSSPRRSSYDDDEERFDVIANTAGRSESYPDHLLSQLSVRDDLDDKTRLLAERIVCQLDDTGYLNATLSDLGAKYDEELAQAREAALTNGTTQLAQPGCTPEDWEDALFVVQSLHPAGTGARDLRECLLLQLYSNEDPAAALARSIVEERLDDLAANRLPQIAKAERVSIEEVKNAVRLIQSLDPQPGLTFSGADALPVRPDVVIELVESNREELQRLRRERDKREGEYEEARRSAYDDKGEYRERLAKGRLHEAEVSLAMLDQDGQMWQVSLPSGPTPEISDMFLALYDNSGRGELIRRAMKSDPEKAEEFRLLQSSLKGSGENRVFRERFLAANDIVRAVKQREITIYRVTREIVARQKDYLAGRIPAPAPLMMKEVAETLDIDIGTVSRAAREKYAQTPLGLRPLREFFTRSVAPAPSQAGGMFGAARPAAVGYGAAGIAAPAVGRGGYGFASSAAAAAGAGGGYDDDEDEGGEGGVSNIQIRNRIKEMIDAEDRKKPLKDDQIQLMLEKEGIVIKRRTVAKHRLKLGYKNYSQRREY